MEPDNYCQFPSLPTGGKTMSILKAQLTNLTQVVASIRVIGGVTVQEIMLLDPISQHVANCRKLHIHEEDILVAVAIGKEKIQERIMNGQKKAS